MEARLTDWRGEMNDYMQMLPHVGGLSDETGVTDHGVYLGHRIKASKIGANWAFSINDAHFQEGDWKDRRATEMAAMDTIRLHRLDAMRV